MAWVALAACWTACAAAGPMTVTVANAAGGSVDDAVVVFDPLDAQPPAAAASGSIDQLNKRFVPHVSVFRTGTAVSFPNSDNIRHQVYSFSTPHPFTLKLYAGQPSSPVVFDKPGLIVLGCNIHDSMVGFVAVVDTPYFAKTPASGVAQFALPPGRYRLRVWHARLAAPLAPREITVGAAAATLPVTIALDASGDSGTPWPE